VLLGQVTAVQANLSLAGLRGRSAAAGLRQGPPIGCSEESLTMSESLIAPISGRMKATVNYCGAEDND
jgi:hypothetical protein